MIIVSICCTTYGQRREIDCDRPPGERISCENRQAAICKVQDGHVYGYCQTPPNGKTRSEIEAWILSFIFDRTITVTEVQENQLFQSVLRRSYAEVGNAKIRFSIPDVSNSTAPSDPIPRSNPILNPSKPVKPDLTKPGLPYPTKPVLTDPTIIKPPPAEFRSSKTKRNNRSRTVHYRNRRRQVADPTIGSILSELPIVQARFDSN